MSMNVTSANITSRLSDLETMLQYTDSDSNAISLDKLESIVYRAAYLARHIFAKTEQAESVRQRELLKENQGHMRSTYNAYSQLGLGAITGLAKMAGGVYGASGDKVTAMTLSALAEAFGFGSQIKSQKSEGDRLGFKYMENLVGSIKADHDRGQQSSRDGKAKVMNLIQSNEQARHQAWRVQNT